MADARFQRIPEESDESLKELVGRFGEEASTLLRNEIALAKLEMRDSIKAYVRGSAMLGVAGALGLLGLVALTAFFVVGLGVLLHNYWLGALIVAVIYFALADIIATGALKRMKEHSLAPEETVESIKDLKRTLKA